MRLALIVIHPFGPYVRGDLITDAAEIAAVQAGENAHHTGRVSVEDVNPAVAPVATQAETQAE
jgi:hypothetical protein